MSIISFAGIVRTLVAVGTVSEASMFEASVFAMPRSGVATSSWVSSWSSASSLASAGIGCGVGWRDVVFAWIGPDFASPGASPVAGCWVVDCCCSEAAGAAGAEGDGAGADASPPWVRW
ncbi:hypothetical protein QE359_003001 [Curtobacterium sp. SORGH_AS776]|nr:hypothetical protein [Curtobacterium sp. SORGH_AS_0776]